MRNSGTTWPNRTAKSNPNSGFRPHEKFHGRPYASRDLDRGQAPPQFAGRVPHFRHEIGLGRNPFRRLIGGRHFECPRRKRPITPCRVRGCVGGVSGVGGLAAGARHPIPAAVVGQVRVRSLLCGVSPRPAGQAGQVHTDHSGGAPIICREEIEEAIESMARLVDDKRQPAAKRLQAWERTYRRLIRSIPPKLPPLPPFEIVDG